MNKMGKIKCKNCNKVFLKYLSRTDCSFCSRKCYGLWASQNRVGKNSAHYRHGMSHTKFHDKWCRMLQRCYDKNFPKYLNYGKRGITICKEWLIFDNFYSDMYPSYIKHLKKFGQKQTTIDRIDNDGNYSKENCKWSTILEQMNNQTRNVFITYNGKTFTLKQWSRILNIKYMTLYLRIRKYGWSIQKAFTT